MTWAVNTKPFDSNVLPFYLLGDVITDVICRITVHAKNGRGFSRFCRLRCQVLVKQRLLMTGNMQCWFVIKASMHKLTKALTRLMYHSRSSKLFTDKPYKDILITATTTASHCKTLHMLLVIRFLQLKRC